MALKLYYVPRTRSARARWLLEEMGLPHELVRLDPKSKPDGYDKLHPLQHVPVLVDGDMAIFESAAICLHLADKDPEHRFAPAPGSIERAHYYQWLFYAVTEIEPHLVAYAAEARRPEAERLHLAVDAARGKLEKALRPLEELLASRPFVLGDRFTAADVVLGSLLDWARSLKLADGFPNALAYATRLHARPAAARARAD